MPIAGPKGTKFQGTFSLGICISEQREREGERVRESGGGRKGESVSRKIFVILLRVLIF